jgi:hypothetical protein
MKVAFAVLVGAFVLTAGAASVAPSGRGADLTMRQLSKSLASIERGTASPSALMAGTLGARNAPNPTVRGYLSRESRKSKSPTLRRVDGGLGYYRRFSNPLPSDPSYFPIGVWLACVGSAREVTADRGAGLNLYVGLCGPSQTDLNLVRNGGMRVFLQDEWLNSRITFGSETRGWMNSDELDMTIGPAGCAEVKRKKRLFRRDGRMVYANFGKGVLFWQSDKAAACFVHAVDLPSTDTYWFTDGNVCGSSEGGGKPGVVKENGCHVGANYGWQVNRVRSLVSPPRSKPVWNFVELGGGITPAQIRSAVYHSIIAGARGITYFNHQFGGNCETQNILRDPCYPKVRAAVKATNKQVTALARVLNAPFVSSHWMHSRVTKAMVKWYRGHFYVFAGSARNGSSRGSFSIPCVGNATASVLGESRTIRVQRGSFSDSFADGNAVHIYRIDGGSACGLKQLS